MGSVDRQREDQQHLEAEATRPLLKAGAIKACDLHGDILINMEDLDAQRLAYAIGTKMVKAGEVNATREEFMDAIKSALEDTSDECPICANYMAD
jgi:hypothetical protein